MHWSDVRIGPVDRKPQIHGKWVSTILLVCRLTNVYLIQLHSRFVVGYLKGIFKHKACPVKLSIKVVESDKHAMVKNFHSARSQKSTPTSSNGTPTSTSVLPEIILDVDHISPGEVSNGDTQPLPENGDEVETSSTHAEPESEKLPPLRYAGDITESDGWITFDKPVTYVYAGKGPYVGVDLMQFPVSLPDDGLIDVVIQEQVGPSRYRSHCVQCLISGHGLGDKRGTFEGNGRSRTWKSVLDGICKSH